MVATLQNKLNESTKRLVQLESVNSFKLYLICFILNFLWLLLYRYISFAVSIKVLLPDVYLLMNRDFILNETKGLVIRSCGNEHYFYLSNSC